MSQRHSIRDKQESLSAEELDALRTGLGELAEENHRRPRETKSGRRKPVLPQSTSQVVDAGAMGAGLVAGIGRTTRPIWILSLLTAASASGSFAYFVWPTPYEVSQSRGTYWRVNRYTGIRETSTVSGWKTDEQVLKSRRLVLPELTVSAGDGRLSCVGEFEPEGDPAWEPGSPTLAFTLTLRLKIPSPRPRESTADRKITVRFTDNNGVSVAAESIPVKAFDASQDGRTLVTERFLKVREEDFYRIASWSAKANWQTILLHVDGRDVPVTWGLDHEPRRVDIIAMEHAYRAKYRKSLDN